MTANADGRARIAIAVSGALLLAVLAWGLVDLHDSNSAILAAVSKPAMQSVAEQAIDYEDANGIMHHVSITAEPGETMQHLVLRLKGAIEETEAKFPRKR